MKIFKDSSTSDKSILKTKTMTKDKDQINKTEDIDIAKTEDIDNTKTEDKDKTTTKTKTENKDLLDMINKRIDTINKSNKLLAKLKAEVTKKIELIYESMCELQDKIYGDDSWLRLVELNKIDAMSEMKNETNMIDEKIHKVSEMDNDTLHLISDKLKEIIN